MYRRNICVRIFNSNHGISMSSYHKEKPSQSTFSRDNTGKFEKFEREL